MQSNPRFWDELALEAYKTIVRKNPDCALAHHNLGLAYTRVDRLNKAIRSFQRALKSDPNQAESFYHLGRVYQQTGKEIEAIRCFNNYKKIKEEGADFEKTPSIVADLLEKLKSGRDPLFDELNET